MDLLLDGLVYEKGGLCEGNVERKRRKRFLKGSGSVFAAFEEKEESGDAQFVSNASKIA